MSARGTLLLVEKCSHCISWYDVESGKREHSVALPSYPHEFVTDRADRYAWVGHYGVETSGHAGAGGHSLLQIDIAAGVLARTIDLALSFDRERGVAFVSQDDDHVEIFDIRTRRFESYIATQREPDVSKVIGSSG